MHKFIYTQRQEAYEALRESGFEDFGTIDAGRNTMYMLGNRADKKVPEQFQRDCLFSNNMFFVSPKGGEQNEQRR